VARLIVLVNSPYHVGPDEAAEWLRGEASALVAVEGVKRAVLSPLASPVGRLCRPSGWLIELECEAPDGADRAVKDDAWKLLLGDLRLLGMRPSVAVVGEASELGR
jgi:hypothetical protein